MAVSQRLVAEAARRLLPRDAGFLERVYGGGLQRYHDRLAAVNFHGLGRVLDAGCGFGQWAIALAETCREVVGIDNDSARIDVARIVAGDHRNARFMVAPITAIPFPDASFDAVFCYSAIYYTDVRHSVAEIARVLSPGGAVYVCSNGLGWYLLNIVKAPNASVDFDPRAYGLRTLLDTVKYRLAGTPPSPVGSIVTGLSYLRRLFEQQGIEIVASGPEGSVHLNPAAPTPRPFFAGRYLGVECASEWIGRRTSQPVQRDETVQCART